MLTDLDYFSRKACSNMIGKLLRSQCQSAATSKVVKRYCAPLGGAISSIKYLCLFAFLLLAAKKRFFGGNPDHVKLGLGLWYG